MSNLATIDLCSEFPAFDTPTLPTWFDAPQPPTSSPTLAKAIPTAGLIFVLFSSPATAVRDVWASTFQMQATVTAPCSIGMIVGKPISRAEALRISRQIMARAEQERLECAAREATRGFPLDEGT